ncbi:recombinase family protein [Marinifilum caeruleilacunae]|uniref:Recombinase family protein n=1 Tax=Marinifilum caeruleilacunae TaxID=2499076 RepID=A0ABX1WXU4_9BACT|nr:recombinase family protein [Marinifilum caeruleilacunae]NOU60816.1 recombinase family protein [Marinifilum caeruleilacunae]
MSTDKKVYKYARVSTIGQKEDRQVDGLKDVDGELVIDKHSGMVPFEERPAGKIILDAVEKGKISGLVVWNFDRLGRNVSDMLKTLEIMKDNEITVTIQKIGMKSYINGHYNQMFDFMSALMVLAARMEYDRIKERQAEGIAIAKAKGIYKLHAGKGKMTDEQFEKQHEDIIELLGDGKSIRNIAKLVKKSVSTVQRVKKHLDTQKAYSN